MVKQRIARYNIASIVLKESDEEYLQKSVLVRERGIKHNDIYKAGLNFYMKELNILDDEIKIPENIL